MSISENKSEILFWVPGGMPLLLHVEGSIAKALINRGHSVNAIICDGVYKACVLRNINVKADVSSWGQSGTSEYGISCEECKRRCARVLHLMGVPFAFIGDFLSEEQINDLWNLSSDYCSWDSLNGLSFNGINIGKNVRSSILRYLQGHSIAKLNNISNKELFIRHYVFSALVNYAVSSIIVNLIKPKNIFMSHAIYIDWGPAYQVFMQSKIPVNLWLSSYNKAHFIFRRPEDILKPDVHRISSSAWLKLKNQPLSIEKKRLKLFFENRYLKERSFDLKFFVTYNQLTNSSIKKTKKVWAFLSHLNWDASCDGAPKLFETYDEWTIKTIEKIKDIDNVNWHIRIHPAEQWTTPEAGVLNLIKREFRNLPEHIIIVPPDKDMNPYNFFQYIDGAIGAMGTSGVEIAYFGKPVVLAGMAHYGEKGFTYDAKDINQYYEFLKYAYEIPPLNEQEQELAIKYAYCHFIQRPIPLKVVDNPNDNFWHLQLDRLYLLEPGKDPFVDFICDRIIDGEDFIMDEDLVQRAFRFQETQTYKKSTVVNHLSVSNHIEAITKLLTQIASAIEAHDVPLAISLINEVLGGYSDLLDDKQKTDLRETYANLQSIVFNADNESL